MSQIRPLQHLAATMRRYPDTGRHVDDFREGRGRDCPEWPDWCFLPMAAWYSIVSVEHDVRVLPPALTGDISILAALGTWRYSQGIYRVDADLMAALADSPISGRLPSEVLYRLPEWCIYVETPGQRWEDDILHGFWAHMEWDANTGNPELRLLLDCEGGLIGLPLHLGAWTVAESIEKAFVVAAKSAVRAGAGMTFPPARDTASQVAPLVSVLLYLCSKAPEIDDARVPGAWPSRPAPKRTKKGWRLFPPDKPRFWDVGAAIGAQLRQASDLGAPTGRTVRPHLRRGHWHGYWTGPLREERKFVYRWISPLVVAAGGD